MRIDRYLDELLCFECNLRKSDMGSQTSIPMGIPLRDLKYRRARFKMQRDQLESD